MALTGDQMSHIDDVTLSTIDFCLQSYAGTPSMSRPRPQRKKSSTMPKRGKKRPWAAEVIAIVAPSMVHTPQSTGEASEALAPLQFGHNLDPL
ncbi:hypothetical protein SUGI_1003880 [Cryptomeria japonica]|nr:hypothetical protein SUGI_1003880 [Cryptomeria japonica]